MVDYDDDDERLTRTTVPQRYDFHEFPTRNAIQLNNNTIYRKQKIYSDKAIKYPT